MRIDDTWGEKALEIVKDINANVLVTSLNRSYSHDECKQFDLIASCTTGTDHIDNRDIPLISLRGEIGLLQDVWATAEHTMALILSLVRHIPAAFEDVKQGNWKRENWQGSELRGKTLGIVGYGRVGRQVAKLADGFGMKVHGVDIKPSSGGDFDEDEYKRTFKFVLKESDIVTVHVPLNESTRGMFGAEQFRLMKPTTYFINTSRGAVVDEDALLKVLDNSLIAGAALDVLCNEPNVELIGGLISYADTHENLIITPHVSGCTTESRHKTQLFIANKIKEYVNGL